MPSAARLSPAQLRRQRMFGQPRGPKSMPEESRQSGPERLQDMRGGRGLTRSAGSVIIFTVYLFER